MCRSSEISMGEVHKGAEAMAKKEATRKKAPQKPENDSDEIEIRLVEPDEITTELDPHLQTAILQNRAGESIDPAFSHADKDGTVRVDVIAKLRRPAVDVEGLQITTRINHIVTGSVAVDDIESVRANTDIVSLKRATRLHSELDFSVGEVNATRDQLEAGLPAGTRIPGGKDVIIGIVDYDFDIQHNDFRNADGSTRLLSLWDQRSVEPNELSPAPYNYGREFSRNAINNALTTADPYQALAYRPRAKSHGAHVTGIAAGNGRATGIRGIASEADVIFVNVSHDDIVDEIDDLDNDETQSLGSSKILLDAVDYIFRIAKSRGQQAVVNLSLGTRGTPHDGTTLVDQGLDELLQEPGRAIVVAAGNSHELRSHAQGEVSNTSRRTLNWEIANFDNSDNEVEIWYPGGNELQIALETPGGNRLAPVLLGLSITHKLGHSNLRLGG
ncbi:MAG: subtilisin family serine protease [Pirellulaceae bacterium]|jgi:subtilisin family serine protease